MPIVLQNIFRFIVLLFLQVLVLNNIQFMGYINPYIYVLFIISLPVLTPRWLSLLLAFALGLSIDIFSNSPGVNTFATVLVAFLRNGIIKLFTALDEGNNPTPSFYSFGISAYTKYLIVMVFIHQIALFFLEAFTFTHIFWFTILKVLLSATVTILIILGYESLIRKKR